MPRRDAEPYRGKPAGPKLGWARVAGLGRWSRDEPVELADVISAGLGLGGVAAYGAIWGQIPQASIAAIGALAVTGLGHGGRRTQPAVLAAGVAAPAAAGWAGSFVGGRGWVTVAAVTAITPWCRWQGPALSDVLSRVPRSGW